MRPIKIAIAEPDKLMLQGITALLSQEKAFQIVVSAATGDRLLKLLPFAKADVALIELNLARTNGIEALPKIRKLSPETAVVLWTQQPQPHHVIQSMRLGASGFLPKNCEPKELKQVLRHVSMGQVYENPLMLQALALQACEKTKPGLSPREAEVLRMLCLQQTNREIARQLDLSARTVEGHRKNLLMKTGARNLAGLVLFAVKEGLVSC